MGRSIYCSSCKKEKEPACLNESRCKACKSEAAKLRRKRKRVLIGKPEDRPERQGKCPECKDKQASGISIAGRCNKCVTISNNERRHALRAEQGLEAIPIRDSSFCHTCQIPKVDGRCIPCRRRLASERKAKKRLEKGLRPWGSGRKPACYDCGNTKEQSEKSYCDACQSKRDKIRWRQVIAPQVNQKKVTDICECGKQKESTRHFYCNECLLTRKRESTKLAARRRRKKLKEDGFILVVQALSPEEKLIRQAARDYLNRLIRRGVVKRKDCEVCGSDKNVEAHHDDYEKPMDVRWLCRIHHDEHHKNNP
jgi:hypothetical protein